ncbi:hypothetical protein HDU76_004495, partial [Blyttiomyces sp. JEL0837]
MKFNTVITAAATILANLVVAINAKRLDRELAHELRSQHDIELSSDAIKVADDPTDPVSSTLFETPFNFTIANPG